MADRSRIAERCRCWRNYSSPDVAQIANRHPVGQVKPLDRLAEVARRHSISSAPTRIEWRDDRLDQVRFPSRTPRPNAADFITDLGLRSSATKIAPAGSTLLTITGATLGVVSRLAVPFAFNQSVIAIYVKDDPRMNAYFYFWLRTNIDLLVQSATGAAQQHVNRNNVCELPIPPPSDELFWTAVAEVAPLLGQQDTLARQSRVLARIRCFAPRPVVGSDSCEQRPRSGWRQERDFARPIHDRAAQRPCWTEGLAIYGGRADHRRDCGGGLSRLPPSRSDTTRWLARVIGPDGTSPGAFVVGGGAPRRAAS